MDQYYNILATTQNIDSFFIEESEFTAGPIKSFSVEALNPKVQEPTSLKIYDLVL